MTDDRAHKSGTFVERLREAPLLPPGTDAAQLLDTLTAAASNNAALAPLAGLLADEKIASFLAGVIKGSPYLKTLIERDPARLQTILRTSPDLHAKEIRHILTAAAREAQTKADVMRALRVYKTEIALITALADLAGIWPVMRVTHVLSEAADATLEVALDFLFRQATEKGDWQPVNPSNPVHGSGYFVLGVGKYGAHELNYSSDIDLIVFFDLDRRRLKPGLEPQPFFVRLTRDLVQLMEERTRDGYVFRTDLRLRPDAGATQIALSTEAAAIYYESFGQNWERAALIKARAVAGDIEAGEIFLEEISPFIWRRSLDFAAIADIHAMKRQIHAFRGFGGISLPGHNIKLGPGGIREIEFFVQTQQLIAGGRQRLLRTRRTLDALEALKDSGWIEPEVAVALADAYVYLRRIEHRLQMVADEQTHEIPEEAADIERVAYLSGYAGSVAFAEALLPVLAGVQSHYARLFEGMPELTAAGANLVFAGEKDDPDTVEALKRMGFTRPSDFLAMVRAWHHGRYPSVRSARARELLTEVQPLLVSALAETADPDLAAASFDHFLAALPAGVQLFSLLKANPALLRLLADIMGTAPRLARILSRRRRLLDVVIDPTLFGDLPSAEQIDSLIDAELKGAEDAQAILDSARIVGSEQSFLIGVKVLSGAINASQAGAAYALLAERMILKLQGVVDAELIKAHGDVAGGGAVVVAMGKLGGREMTASSDLDLIVVYDFDPDHPQSDGPKPLAPTQYYSRFTQRLITVLSAPTAEGTLYEVDMRLRPSGQKGPVAAQFSTFAEYQTTEAWTWEHMALTRARVLSGPPELQAKVEAAIRETLVRPRERAKIAADVLDMRKLIAAEKGTDNIWDLKQVRGGLVDLEFIAQYLQLVHADRHPEVLDQNTLSVFQKLAAAGLITEADAQALIAAPRLIHNLTQVLRLCLSEAFDPAVASKGLKELLARAGDAPDFAVLEGKLRQALTSVSELFSRLVG